MNKAELMEYGIPENKLKDFQRRYHEDAKRMARDMIRKESQTDSRKVRYALSAIVELLEGDALRRVLEVANTEYYKQGLEDKAYNSMILAPAPAPADQNEGEANGGKD